jgi:hypothetical protein
MPSGSEYVAQSPRFERQVPGGRHDLVFRIVFGSDGKAARFFKVSRMTIWRWRHDRVPLPQWVVKALTDLVQRKVAEVHEAQQELRYFMSLAPRPPRPLSGCCAGYERNSEGPRGSA